MARDRALAVQHEFRRAGRARCGEDVARRIDPCVVDAEPRPRLQSVEGDAAPTLEGGRDGDGLLADRDDRREGLQRRRIDVGQDRQEIDAAEAGRAGQNLGARAAHDVGNFDGAIARVHRDGDRAQPDASEIEDRIGGHVWQPQRDTVARTYSEIPQVLRDAQRNLEQLRETDRAFAMDERRRIGRVLGPIGEESPDIGGGML